MPLSDEELHAKLVSMRQLITNRRQTKRDPTGDGVMALALLCELIELMAEDLV